VYLNAARVVDKLRSAATSGTRAFVVDASKITALDATGALALARSATALEAAGVEVIVSGLDPKMADVLTRAGFWSGPAAIDRADDVAGAMALASAPAATGGSADRRDPSRT
jgi:SulP family sulfate permease